MRVVVIIYIMLSVVLMSCQSNQDNEQSSRLRVVATTGMIGDAVREIAGDSVSLTTLMGPGVDPHLYKASQGDVNALAKADLIFYNGLFLEGKMQEILEGLKKQKKVVAVSQSIPEDELLAFEGHPYPDPHIWFDVALWQEAVKEIGQALIAADPQRASYYEHNVTGYLQELRKLNEYVKQQVNRIPEEQRIMVTAHDAFGYFGRAYGVEVRGLQGISTLSEYGLRDIRAMVDYLAEQEIKAVFVESSVPQKALEAVVAGSKERGHPVKIGGTLYSDAMGESGTEEGTYVGMVRYNVNTLVEALK